jgi:hypothetical protein
MYTFDGGGLSDELPADAGYHNDRIIYIMENYNMSKTIPSYPGVTPLGSSSMSVA